MKSESRPPINWIVPFAGRGERTQALGNFKPYIEVGKHRVLEWMLLGLKNNIQPGDQFVFVTTRFFEDHFKVKEWISNFMDEQIREVTYRFHFTEDTPPGPAATASKAIPLIQNNDACIVINSDQFIWFEIPVGFGEQEIAFLPVYAEYSGKSSYVRVDPQHNVLEVKEKQLISQIASAGVYGFSSKAMFEEALNWTFENRIMRRGEYYIGPAFNHLIDIGIETLATRAFLKLDLGKVSEINLFEKSFEPILSRVSWDALPYASTLLS